MRRTFGSLVSRFKAFNTRLSHNVYTFMRTGFRIPIATKLILSFLAVIIIVSAVFTIVGIRLISGRILTEAQQEVKSRPELCQGHLPGKVGSRQ